MKKTIRPQISVSVMIIKKGKVLLGKRLNRHANGEYTFPGGHLKYLELSKDCAKREVREECGLEIKNLKPQFFCNVTNYKPKHYVHLGFIAEWSKGRPKVLEPEKFEHWRWVSLDKLPKPLFLMCRLAMESYKGGKWYFESKPKKKAIRQKKSS